MTRTDIEIVRVDRPSPADLEELFTPSESQQIDTYALLTPDADGSLARTRQAVRAVLARFEGGLVASDELVDSLIAAARVGF